MTYIESNTFSLSVLMTIFQMNMG